MNPFRQPENQIRRFQTGHYCWKDLYKYYTDIKAKYNLISSDIFRQLQYNYGYADLYYLSSYAFDENPSNRSGTFGKRLRDCLCTGVTKTDWSPSTAQYKDKLDEFMITNPLTGISANIVDDVGPKIEVTVCLDESRILSEQQLKRIFTIDGIVPEIHQVHYSRYL